MKPFVRDLISEKDMALFKKVKEAIMSLPDDLPLGYNQKQKCDTELSCHILAEAVSRKFALKRTDGKYEPQYSFHSWCQTQSGHIIDVYPCGELTDIQGGPKFVYVQEASLPEKFRTSNQLHTIYRAENINMENFIDKDAFEVAVATVISFWK